MFGKTSEMKNSKPWIMVSICMHYMSSAELVRSPSMSVLFKPAQSSGRWDRPIKAVTWPVIADG